MATITRQNIDNRIKESFDVLQDMMERNEHLTNLEAVKLQIEKCRVFCKWLDDEHRDYIHGCMYAIETKASWDV